MILCRRFQKRAARFRVRAATVREFPWPCGPPIAMKVSSSVALSYWTAWTVEVGSALDQLKPEGSMVWDTRESQ